MRIAFLGIGAVGGVFGGLITEKNQKTSEDEFIFIARAETKEQINKTGLTLKIGDTHKIIKPDLCSDLAEVIGPLDVIVHCTKSYSIKSALFPYLPLLKDNGIIISTQNTISSFSEIEDTVSTYSKDILLLDGIVYVAANKVSTAVIEERNGPKIMRFGTDKKLSDTQTQRLHHLAHSFSVNGIDAQFCTPISEILWEKFFFVSSIAMVCSAYQCNFGEVKKDQIKLDEYKNYIYELAHLAKAKGITDSETIAKRTYDKLFDFPDGTFTSLQLDLKKGGLSELDGLCYYVIEESHKHGLNCPFYENNYKRLSRL